MRVARGIVEISDKFYEAIQVVAADCLPVVIYNHPYWGLKFTYCEKFTESDGGGFINISNKVHNIFNIDQHENEQRN